MAFLTKFSFKVLLIIFCLPICSLALNSDFDNDGKADVFTLDTFGDVHWYESTGQGYSVNYIIKVPVVGIASSLQIADLDSDGNMDLIVGRSGTSNLWYECNGDDSLRLVGYIGSDAVVSGIAVADLDENGYQDVFILSSDEKIVWYECNGDDSLIWISNPMNAGSGAKSIVIEELDGDGVDDIVILKDYSLILYGVDSSSYAFQWKENVDYLPEGYFVDCSYLYIGDLDSDSNADIVLLENITGSFNWYEVWGISPLWYLDSVETYTGYGDNYTGAVFLDIDSDGVNELLLSKSDDYVQLYEFSGQNSLIKESSSLFTNGTLGIVGVPNASDIQNTPQLQDILEIPCFDQGGVLGSDINRDCRVDLLDLAIIADGWLE